MTDEPRDAGGAKREEPAALPAPAPQAALPPAEAPKALPPGDDEAERRAPSAERGPKAEGPQRGVVHPPAHAAHDARHAGRWIAALLALAVLYFGGHLVHDRWQRRTEQAYWAHDMTGGDPTRGRVLARQLGCGGCHTIPGVDGAHGLVGPPLAGIADRVYVGGVVVNSPDNLVRWIMNPKAFDPKTAMPAVGATEEQARHLAAYLLTLR